MTLLSRNPASGERIAEYAVHTAAEQDVILEACRHACGTWRKNTFSERAACFHRLADLLRMEKGALAAVVTAEMGKTLAEARAEIEKCAGVASYFAERAEGLLQDEVVKTEAAKSYVCFQPLGVILGLMPWNFPVWQVLRYAAPALMAGNTTVLKHANQVTGTALAIETLFRKAGFPEGVFRVLVIDIPAVEGVIQDPRIAAVSLTGSVAAGRAVAATAGAALKKVVLELGGSDPFIVLDDANVDAAVEAGVFSRLMVAGQVCIAAKRFIVTPGIRAEFEEKFVARMKAARMGPPAGEETDMGPMARGDLREALDRQVQASVAAGARCLLGGALPEGPGYYYPPTVLTNVAPGMPAYEKEIFGPVAAIIPVENTEEALRVANDTAYGLGAALFSKNIEAAEAMVQEEIEAGGCFVNSIVRSDARLPFGGIKASGFGRELGTYGIKEFVNIKTVYIAE
jgi:succinate-semialdehyde dehydrogenase / glutarate-semialdehyde dehydrogenase